MAKDPPVRQVTQTPFAAGKPCEKPKVCLGCALSGA
jgi:hypothetical protein